MTRQEILRRYPHASPSFIKANLDAQDTGANSELECDHENASHANPSVIQRSSERYLVRYTLVRKRLLDDDNACTKAHTDALRYLRIIPDDNPGICSIETTQRKCSKSEGEYTLIEVFKIATPPKIFAAH